MNLNDIMRMRAQVGMFQQKANQKDSTSSFQGAFKDTDLFESQVNKISEAVSRLKSESSEDSQVMDLVSNWETVKSKLSDSTCGEIKADLNKLMQNVTTIYQSKLSGAMERVEEKTQVPDEDAQQELADTVEQQWHEQSMHGAFEGAIEKQPETFLTYIKALQSAQEGNYGEKMSEALETLDSAFFNMQTLLIITLIESIENGNQQTVIDETFSEYSEEHSEEVKKLVTDLRSAGRSFLDKILYSSSSMDESERNLHSRLNDLISNSDMSYEVAQGINWFVGTRLDDLEEAIEDMENYISYDITDPETFALVLSNITELEGSERKQGLKDLALELYEMEEYELVGKVFDKMNELGLGNSVFVFMLNIRPDLNHPEEGVKLLSKYDQILPLVNKMEKLSDRENFSTSLLAMLSMSSLESEMNELIDAKIPQIISNLTTGDARRQAVSHVVKYYCHNRDDVERAYSVFNTSSLSQEQKKNVATGVGTLWYARGSSQVAPWKQGWKNFVERFLDDPTTRTEAKNNILKAFDGRYTEELLRKKNPDWDAINE